MAIIIIIHKKGGSNMGFFNSTTIDIKKLVMNKKDGKQHIIQFEL